MLLDDPEVRVFLDHLFDVAGDVSGRDRKEGSPRADLSPLAPGQSDAGSAVRLPALASKPGYWLAALHPPRLALVDAATPRLVVRQWEETFAQSRVEVEELIDAGDQVVAVLRGIGRMKDSDAEIGLRYAIVFTIRDGKIAAGREYSPESTPWKPPGCRSSRQLTLELRRA